jgi:hypothetical protein
LHMQIRIPAATSIFVAVGIFGQLFGSRVDVFPGIAS